MNTKNTKVLLKKYPKIFRQHALNPKKTAMCWLFECGDGWFFIIYQLCSTIQNYIDNYKLKQLEAVQVKEKFGGLRFYVDKYFDDKIRGMIALAEEISYSICEDCGATKDVVSNKTRYHTTLCKACRKIRNN